MNRRDFLEYTGEAVGLLAFLPRSWVNESREGEIVEHEQTLPGAPEFFKHMKDNAGNRKLSVRYMDGSSESFQCYELFLDGFILGKYGVMVLDNNEFHSPTYEGFLLKGGKIDGRPVSTSRFSNEYGLFRPVQGYNYVVDEVKGVPFP